MDLGGGPRRMIEHFTGFLTSVCVGVCNSSSTTAFPSIVHRSFVDSESGCPLPQHIYTHTYAGVLDKTGLCLQLLTHLGSMVRDASSNWIQTLRKNIQRIAKRVFLCPYCGVNRARHIIMINCPFLWEHHTQQYIFGKSSCTRSKKKCNMDDSLRMS